MVEIHDSEMKLEGERRVMDNPRCKSRHAVLLYSGHVIYFAITKISFYLDSRSYTIMITSHDSWWQIKDSAKEYQEIRWKRAWREALKLITFYTWMVWARLETQSDSWWQNKDSAEEHQGKRWKRAWRETLKLITFYTRLVTRLSPTPADWVCISLQSSGHSPRQYQYFRAGI